MLTKTSTPLLALVVVIASALMCATCGESHRGSSITTPSPAPETPLAAQATGEPVAEMGHYDRAITDLMAEYGVPGGALAVVRDGRLVLSRGYGLADVAANQRVEPDSLFRIASVSKPITAAGVLKLVEDGKVRLEDRAFDILSGYRPASGFVDPRVEEITIGELLYHAGGWDRTSGFDPMFSARLIAQAQGISSPPDHDHILRYMTTQPLDFDPGSKSVYSNFGYSILGRIIESVSGLPYEEFIQREILTPAGIKRMQIGGSLAEERQAGEVRYYGAPDEVDILSVFGDDPPLVPFAYGGFNTQALDAHGGWIASAPELARFVAALDGSGGKRLLEEGTVEQMVARPPDPIAADGEWGHYAMGWWVSPQGDGATWRHDGLLPGTQALLVKAHDGVIWAALFNWRPWMVEDDFLARVEEALWQAHDATTEWPAHDLFEDDE